MGFLDTLRRVLSGETRTPGDTRLPSDSRTAPGTPPLRSSSYSQATTPGPEVYDRVQWQKKLKRILDELPGSEPQWQDLMTEARALGFEPEWIHHCQVEEFAIQIRRAVSDRHFTQEEHRKLDLARDLIGLPEAEAEAILHAIVAEAEAFFGKPVEEG